MKILYKIIALVLCLFSVNGIVAQAQLTNPFKSEAPLPSFGLDFGVGITQSDVLLDIGAGYDDAGYDYSVSINCLFRPYNKTIVREMSEHYFYQIEEKEIGFSLDLEKRLYFLRFGNDHRLGIYATLKAGYAWENHKGITNLSKGRFFLSPAGGISLELKRAFRVYAGYLYFDQKNATVPPHLIQIRFMFSIR